MVRMRAGTLLAAVALLGCSVGRCLGNEADGRVLQTFEVHERYHVSHPRQIVDFDLDAPVDALMVHVRDADERAVAFQLIDGGRKVAIETDLPANQSRRWTLVRGAAPRVSQADRVEVRTYAQDGGGYEITNGLAGVRVPAPATESSARWKAPIDGSGYGAGAPRVFLPAPVQGILYRDGRWSGTGPNGVVLLATRLVGMRTRFLERGPLKVVVEVAYAVERQEYRVGATVVSPAGPGHYTCTITVMAGQPSVLFEEDTDLMMTWSMNLYPGLHPTNARYRGFVADRKEYGYEPDGGALGHRHARAGDVDAQVDLQYDRPMTPSYARTETTWRPMVVWDRWAANTGWYWQLFDAKAAADSNLVGIFAGRASRALSPGASGVSIYTLPPAKGAAPEAGIAVGSYRRGADGSIYPRSRFQWGLFVGTKGKDLKGPTEVQPINLQMNLHGGFNLNKVHRFTVDFPDPPGGYGALYMDRRSIERLKDQLQQGGPSGKKLYAYLYGTHHQVRPLIDMWADPTGGKIRDSIAAVSKTATDLLNTLVNGTGIHDMDFGYWHGGLAMMRYGVWIDQILGDSRTTEAQRREVKAAAVLFANVLWDNDFVPMDNHDGINLGTANMPVQQAGYRNFYALLLARDPDMAERVRLVEAAVRGTVRNIINEYGAEIGCPHYIGASFAPTLNSLLQLKQLGMEDPFKAEPRLGRFAEFFMNLLTPPEPRVGGKRALISVGDSSTEPSEIFGVLGTGFRDADPALSARLVGSWSAGGRPHSFFFGTTMLTIDESLPAADPKLGDANFPGYYSVLRHGWGTPDETAVWFINGDHYSDHRHNDHGSIVIYALGKPLSIDWGSLGTPRVPGAYMHSGVVLEQAIGHPWDRDPLLSDGGRWSHSTQHVFATSAEGAYARASFQNGDRTWMRSVLSIRGDPAHPILVIRDSFSGEGRDAPKVWSLNLMAESPVETPIGPVLPELRRYPVKEYRPGEPGELPSASRPFRLSAGVNRFGFAGRYDVDWDVYTLADHAQQALIGNWAVTPWGDAITDKEERQHILRIRGSGPFTTVILPWRRGARPADLDVRREGEAIVIRSKGVTARIDANGYTYSDGAGSVTRRYDGQRD